MKATGKLPEEAGSGYNAQQPYVGRDPRFYANILYNDAPWQGNRIQTWYQVNGNATTYGKDAGSDIKYTATSYYCRKYWPEVYQVNGGSTTLLNYVFFRYAEMLLNYAEAQNEYLDAPDASVYDAVNQIRRRASVQMPALPAGLSKVQMRQAIRHERAIELAFEDHRWFDIMRWKIGPQTVAQPMYRMDVRRNTNGSFTYSKVLLGNSFQKTFEDRQHYYPIPRNEVYKSKGVLVQNPGWEK
jgi:starch-binding outer membrane protein, SusD/RagB family